MYGIYNVNIQHKWPPSGVLTHSKNQNNESLDGLESGVLDNELGRKETNLLEIKNELILYGTQWKIHRPFKRK